MPWPSRWLLWQDFRLPADDVAARDAFEQVLERADVLRVEVACAGGIGRTGTALACLAILDGIPLLMPWTTYDSGTTAAPLRHRPSAGTSPVSQQGGLPRLESGAPKSSATFLSLPELSGLEAPGDAEGRWSLDGSQ
jgi:hypothetical protein